MKLLKAEAGVNDGKAGLLSTAGLFAKGGIFDKKSESFNIQELDPYLLFDARSSMLGTLENPTLDLDPATPSTLDVITATRAGVATYTDADGNIATASADTVRVDYTQGAELTPTKFQNIGYTDFNSPVWVKNNSTLTLNQETAPDGTQTAAKYLGSGTGQDLYYNIDSNGPFTFSFFVKYINAPYIRLRTGSVSTWFNLTTGSVATQNHDSATIQDVGDGWFRLSGTTTSTSSFSRFYIHPHASDNTTSEQSGGSFYLWGPQLEEGTTATDFVANTTGSPKFTGISATFAPRVPMILCEPSATNLITYSEDFSQWNIGDTQPLLNRITSPDGLTNGAKLNAFNITNQGYVSQSISVTSSTTYTLSVYAKKGEQKYLCLVGLNPFTESYFDLESGTALSNNATSSSIEDVGDGWFRLSATFDADTSTKFAGFYLSQTGNSLVASSIPNGEGVYIWGAQLEAGSVSTSYIPTSGGDSAARTRAADNLEITGSDFDFYNQSEGTVYAEFLYDHDQTSKYVYSITETGANEIRAQLLASALRTRYTVNSSHLANLENSGILKGSLNRIAFSYKTNNFRANLNGGSDEEELSGTASINPIKLSVGSRSSANHLNGHIKRLLFWPTHSSRL